MQRLYETYREVAEFRIVYIHEAHAADSKWPVGYAHERKLVTPPNFGARCENAEKLLADKDLTIPTVVDGMDNAANLAYSGWPDRVFVVRKDGTLGVAAKEGPFGFVPAIEATETWLAEYAKSGREIAVKSGAVRMDELD